MERFNLDVEIQIIGNCINPTETFLKVMDKGIEPEDFYNTNNKKLFTAITQCYIAKNTTDVLTFNGFLKANGVTITDTTSILSGTIIFTDITPYLNELLELRVVRERLRFAKEIQEGILKTDEDIKK